MWAASGGQCGKYLVESMPLQLAGLERHGELIDGADRYSDQVRLELLAMSAALMPLGAVTSKIGKSQRLCGKIRGSRSADAERGWVS